MMYKGKASMHISEDSDDFSVIITTPLHRADTRL